MNNQNIYWDIKDITEGDITEPVTAAEIKDYMRLEGFVDTDESTTESLSDFDDDDTLITDLIKSARRKLEKFLGVSLVDHTWKVCFSNGAGDIEFPYGPVTGSELTSLTYKDGTAVDEDDYELTGFDFVSLDTTYGTNRMIAIYDAGYEDVPDEIILAIKKIVAHWYDTRAMGDLPEGVLNSVIEYQRPWVWLG